MKEHEPNREILEYYFSCAIQELIGKAPAEDEQLRDTPKRWARMMINDACHGLFSDRPAMTAFSNAQNLDEFYMVGPVEIRSLCAHHFVPVIGKCWIGVLPGDRLLGLSKFARLAQWVFARPTQQEDATVRLADELEDVIGPRGLGVMVRASHLCMTWRGVRSPDAEMQTTVLRGMLRDKEGLRSEFLHAVTGSGK